MPAGRIEKRAVGRDGVAGFGVEVAPCRRLLGQTHPVEAHVAADVAGCDLLETERQRLPARSGRCHGEVARHVGRGDTVDAIVARGERSQQQRAALAAERQSLTVDRDEVEQTAGAVEPFVVDREDDAARVVLYDDLLVEFARGVVGHDVSLNRYFLRDADRAVVVERFEDADALDTDRRNVTLLRILFVR